MKIAKSLTSLRSEHTTAPREENLRCFAQRTFLDSTQHSSSGLARETIIIVLRLLASAALVSLLHRFLLNLSQQLQPLTYGAHPQLPLNNLVVLPVMFLPARAQGANVNLNMLQSSQAETVAEINTTLGRARPAPKAAHSIGNVTNDAKWEVPRILSCANYIRSGLS